MKSGEKRLKIFDAAQITLAIVMLIVGNLANIISGLAFVLIIVYGYFEKRVEDECH